MASKTLDELTPRRHSVAKYNEPRGRWLLLRKAYPLSTEQLNLTYYVTLQQNSLCFPHKVNLRV